MVAYRSRSRTIFMIVLYTVFTLFCISILIPFINAIAISLSDRMEVARGNVGLWPQGFNLEAYKKLVYNMQFLRTAANSVFLTVVNTVLVVIISLSAAFALSHKHLVGKKVFMHYILITMFFSGGLIPTYLTVNKLGLTDTYLALIRASSALFTSSSTKTSSISSPKSFWNPPRSTAQENFGCCSGSSFLWCSP